MDDVNDVSVLLFLLLFEAQITENIKQCKCTFPAESRMDQVKGWIIIGNSTLIKKI